MENFVAPGMDRATSRERLEASIFKVPGSLALTLRACSACDGDYEDPDRTARMPDEGEEDFAREKAQDKGQGRVENETELDDENPER